MLQGLFYFIKCIYLYVSVHFFRVLNAAGKSHQMCKEAMKQKKLFDAYYFALRTEYLFQSMKQTTDFELYSFNVSFFIYLFLILL